MPKIPCPICGRKFTPQVNNSDGSRQKYCSSACGQKANFNFPANVHPDYAVEYIVRCYPEGDVQAIASHLGISVLTVRNIANKRGVKRSRKALVKQYEIVSRYMTDNNSMKKPGAAEKVRQFHRDHPEERKRIYSIAVPKMREYQRGKPTKLEQRLFQILDRLAVSYEPFAILKDKFIVDCRIGRLIIEADGDYWHGHPRFAPLSERQLKQQKRDDSRNKYLTACGYEVIRIWESDLTPALVEQLLRDRDIISE